METPERHGTTSPRWAIAAWLLAVAACAIVVARTTYVADMSAFLPRNPTAQQQVLVEQITRGPLSRTLLLAVEGGTPAGRATLSQRLAQRMRAGGQFTYVGNGESSSLAQQADWLLRNRYLLSSAVDPERFTAEGLHRAIAANIGNLAGSLGTGLKELFPRDPTGEMLALVGDLDTAGRPQTSDGVWTSPDGRRAMLIAMSRADGADTDAQERLLADTRASFDEERRAVDAQDARLLVSGSAVFAVDARSAIKTQATRLTLIGAAGMLGLLLFAFRSLRAVGLCLLPVLSGALAGVVAVSLVFGSVHGITIGFGSTLIGEAVDYSIYYFIPAQPGDGARRWLEQFWPTIRLGMLTSVCGFAALVFSGFPGLAQLGVYSIAGLVAAALVTRFVLPRFALPAHAFRAGGALLARLAGALGALRRLALPVLAVSLAALVFLLTRPGSIWNPQLSGLSPVSAQARELDESLRADLGAPQLRFLLVAESQDRESALHAAEYCGDALQALERQGRIDGFESASKIVPSLAEQRMRQQSLPDAADLRRNLSAALVGLPLRAERLSPFLDDVAAARRQPLLTREQLGDGDLGASFDALLAQGGHGVTAFLPIREASLPQGSSAEQEDTQAEELAAALQSAARGAQERLTAAGDRVTRVSAVDMATESARIYERYFREILALSGVGVLAIVLLLAAHLRDARRTAAVLLPLGLAVLLVLAGLVALGERLNLLHLVGTLLIVAVGSNYALFFNQGGRRREQRSGALAPATLLSVLLANASTAIGFGVLAFSTVPVLHALGATVAPGAVLALVLSILFAVDLRLDPGAAQQRAAP